MGTLLWKPRLSRTVQRELSRTLLEEVDGANDSKRGFEDLYSWFCVYRGGGISSRGGGG